MAGRNLTDTERTVLLAAQENAESRDDRRKLHSLIVKLVDDGSVSQTDISRTLGVSRQRVHIMLQKGRGTYHRS